jgi:hypothetical protein
MITRSTSTCAHLAVRLLRSLAVLCVCSGVASAQTAGPESGGETAGAAVVAWMAAAPGTPAPAPDNLILVTEKERTECLAKCKLTLNKCIADAEKVAKEKKLKTADTGSCAFKNTPCIDKCSKIPK